MGERISILGCGWYGLPLGKKLIEKGYEVKGSTTSLAKLPNLEEEKIKGYLIDFGPEETTYDADFFECDILIISIPPKSKSPELKNFQAKMDAIIIAVKQHEIKQVIFISSTGVYQDNNFIVNENDMPKPDTDSGKAILQAEKELCTDQSFTTTIIRFAGLIGPNRNLAKHFAGKTDIANGLAPINLIHLDDCLGITLSIIEKKAFGYIFHGVAPSHPTRADFYTKACEINDLPIPSFSNELLNWKQIESINVPKILDYQFTIDNWQLATVNQH